MKEGRAEESRKIVHRADAPGNPDPDRMLAKRPEPYHDDPKDPGPEPE